MPRHFRAFQGKCKQIPSIRGIIGRMKTNKKTHELEKLGKVLTDKLILKKKIQLKKQSRILEKARELQSQLDEYRVTKSILPDEHGKS